MSGHTRPLTCCDRDCEGANGCRIGGYRCDRCGLWFCGDELETVGDRTLCGDCADEYREEQEESEGE